MARRKKTKNPFGLQGTGTGPGVHTVHTPVEPLRRAGIDYPDKLLPLFAEPPEIREVPSLTRGQAVLITVTIPQRGDPPKP